MHASHFNFIRLISAVYLISLLTLLTNIALAYPIIGYATTYTPFGGINGLWKIDFGTGDIQLVNDHMVRTEYAGLAIDSKGQLYSLADGFLTAVDPTTGAESEIGSVGHAGLYGADFLGDTLVAASSGSPSYHDITFFTVDVSSASRTDFLTLSDIGTIGGMTLLDPTTAFFTTSDSLYTADIPTGTVSRIGDLSSVWWGLDFGPDGNLYGLGDTGIYRVNPFTAAETLILDASPIIGGGSFWTGLAIIAAVPEPTSIALLGMGLGIFGFMLRRKS